MKILTILGTRPEIIRLSQVIKLLDQHSQHVLAHTGQNFDDRLSKIFFQELNVRQPDIFMGVKANTFSAQIARILEKTEEIILQVKPDRLLLLGDTNSSMSAIVARRMGVPVFHMEAGNRCYDDRVPEEINRRIIDHCSTVLLPYTNRSRDNLLKEGIDSNRIYVTGNPIKQVIDAYESEIAKSTVLEQLGLESGKFFLVTLHRSENVDEQSRLQNFIDAFVSLNQKYAFPVVVSFHPRTQAKVQAFGLDLSNKGLQFMPPFGFFDFIKLEQSAFCILSDSGTVQEEACLFGVPNITIRDVTERPETLECGSNILSGADIESIINAVSLVTEAKKNWQPPAEYLATNVAEVVLRIITGYRHPDLSEQGWFKRKSLL